MRDYGVGAVVLFRRNIRDAGHARPLLVAVDQENGLVSRVAPPLAPQMPGPMALAAGRAVAEATGATLRHLGINVDYAPVADVNSEPLNPVIGVRSPGDDPARVASCAKHFPGHGDTRVDSHYGLPVVRKTRRALDDAELVPFRAAVACGVDVAMTAHIALPCLGAGSDLPATLSPEALAVLRHDLGFRGVILTDCMEMDGVRARFGTVEASLMALQAGADHVMICHTYAAQTAAIDRVCEALAASDISPQRVKASLRRLADLKSRFVSWDDALRPRPPEELEALNKTSEALARRVYRDAVTLVRSQPGSLPLSRTARTVFVSSGPDVPRGGAVDSGDVAAAPTRVPWVAASFGDELRARNPAVVQIRFAGLTLSEDEWRLVDEAEVVVLATRNAHESPYQAAVGLEVARRRGEAPLVAIAACNPYDFLECPQVRTYLAIYDPTVEAFRAAVDMLYGEPSRGKLPVAAAKG